MAKHEAWELQSMQSAPLSVKISMTKQRIREWVDEFGEDGVYISFSGGKDSTVLLDIVRKLYPNITAVYVDTGLEYPEIKEFVKKFENVEVLRPKITFKQVIEKNGYPFISKEVSDLVSLAKRGYKSGLDKLNGVDKNGNKSEFRKGFKKWKFLLDSPFKISDECCWINKKAPIKEYEHRTNKKPMLAMMASESVFRKTSWLENGCNAFNSKRPISNPMAFWTDQDVLLYIKQNQLEIASVYGDVVYSDDDGMEYQEVLFDNQMNLKTTGCKRTGCMYCGYGCHLNNDDRFVRLKVTHPKIYEYVFKPESEGGLGYKEKIDWLNKNGNLNIRY